MSKKDGEIATGKYSKKRQNDKFKGPYNHADKFDKEKDELYEDEEEENKDKVTKKSKIAPNPKLVKFVFRNLKHHKSGKIVEKKPNGEERVLDLSDEFADEPDHADRVREQRRGKLNRLLPNEAENGGFTVATMDYYHELNPTSSSEIQLALPSELAYLCE